jgi:GAF domain-containing protein
MAMSAAWSTQQLAEFLAVVSAIETAEAAARAIVERTAEGLDAEVVAIVSGGEVLASVGYPAGAVPVAELAAVTPDLDGELAVPGLGVCSARAVRLEHPPGATLVVARHGTGLALREASLLRGIAHASAITMRMLCLLDDERAAREESAQRQRRFERLANEQAGLRRVATLVARAASPEEVFAAVTAEVGRVLGTDHTSLVRYDPDGGATVVGSWTSTGVAGPVPVGSRVGLGGRNVATLVARTGRPTRIDDYADATGQAADVAYAWGIRAAVGVPVSVEGRLWGVMNAVSTSARQLPADTEARLVGFTELVATAIANAQARVEVRGFAEEQVALRRVATLVARGAAPEEVFATVSVEVGRVLDVDRVSMSRYDPDGGATILGMWSSTGDAFPTPVGSRAPLGGRNVPTLVFETRRPVRIDDYAAVSGPTADVARAWGVRAAVGVPISVEDRLWGVMIAASGAQPLPADIEARLVGFTELIATAIANAQARVELRGFAAEQAALRRVATLVARAAAPEEVFAAVTAEVGRLLGCDFTLMNRYDPDRMATVVGVWGRTDTPALVPVGRRVRFDGRNVSTEVFQTSRPARIDHYGPDAGPGAAPFVAAGIRSVVGAPISIEGRLWGVMMALTREQPLPADTEDRLAGFTELVATAIANAESQAQLTASRARIVTAADYARRRIERDLHDGAQQRLVSLAFRLRAVQAALPPEADGLEAQLGSLAGEATSALDELRELARGIHPVALAEGGLRPALKGLARRAAVPVELAVRVDRRLPEQIELASYYSVSEALVNAAKHADAAVVHVEVDIVEGDHGDGVLRVCVRDDGRGGATFTGGSGLLGLKDRAEALGGLISLLSAPGTGTTVQVDLPLTPTRPGPD